MNVVSMMMLVFAIENSPKSWLIQAMEFPLRSECQGIGFAVPSVSHKSHQNLVLQHTTTRSMTVSVTDALMCPQGKEVCHYTSDEESKALPPFSTPNFNLSNFG